MSAIISDCGQYRYLLTRPSEVELPERGTALFLMLNPSTADASLDDPTIRRCRGFAKSWGCALRATNPKELWRHDAPIGAENNYWLEKLAKEYGDVVCAWGANAKPERVNEVYQILKDAGARLWCLGTTKSGAPKHPLYIKADQKLIAWEPTDALA